MNSLMLVGLAVLAGTISGKISQKLKIPQVVGYILLGLLIGKSFLHVFDGATQESLTSVVNFTLGIIGCVIGAELKLETFRRFGLSIYAILIGEGMLAFILVTIGVTLLTQKLYLGLILGAIASATDPASTINVLWEYKARGSLTRTVTSIVALDDGLALIIYGLVSVFSKAMITHQQFSLWTAIGGPLLEILKCLLLGAVMGVVSVKLLKHLRDDSMVLAYLLGVIAAVAGISVSYDLDLILSTMAVGATIANLVPKISAKYFDMIRKSTASLYILFFVGIGAKLDIHIFLQSSILAVVAVYLLTRSAGKIFGAMGGALLTGARREVVKYTGLCLFTQGGVAMGLALSINHNMSSLGPDAQAAGLLIVNIVAATTFIVQLVGPPFVKWAATRADEVNRDLTRDDVIDSLKVRDIESGEYLLVHKNTPLPEILQDVKNNDTFNFLVLDEAERLVGKFSLLELKDAMLEEDLYEFIVAEDIALTPTFILTPEEPLREVVDYCDKRNIVFLPIVKDMESRRVAGILEPDRLYETIDRILLDRRQGME